MAAAERQLSHSKCEATADMLDAADVSPPFHSTCQRGLKTTGASAAPPAMQDWSSSGDTSVARGYAGRCIVRRAGGLAGVRLHAADHLAAQRLWSA
jgi:hypothetical protein